MTALNTLCIAAGTLLGVSCVALVADRDRIAIPAWVGAVACIVAALVVESIVFN